MDKQVLNARIDEYAEMAESLFFLLLEHGEEEEQAVEDAVQLLVDLYSMPDSLAPSVERRLRRFVE